MYKCRKRYFKELTDFYIHATIEQKELIARLYGYNPEKHILRTDHAQLEQMQQKALEHGIFLDSLDTFVLRRKDKHKKTIVAEPDLKTLNTSCAMDSLKEQDNVATQDLIQTNAAIEQEVRHQVFSLVSLKALQSTTKQKTEV